MRAVVLILALLAGPAFADAIARQESDWVRLTLKPCASPAVAAVLQKHGMHPDEFKAASAHVGGKDYQACWRPIAGGAYMVYEDGDEGVVPQGDLKPAPEA